MANGRFIISKAADETLTNLMIILEIERPLGLKIALSKGILININYRKDEEKMERGREIPDRVVLQGFEYSLYSHLIFEKEKRVISDGKELDDHIRFYVEIGLNQIKRELDELPAAENYLLGLMNSSSEIRSHSSNEKDANTILNLLGF